MKRLFLLFIAISFGSTLLAQEIDTTTIAVVGTVIDESTKEPVEARIKYESLPYGSKIGVFTGSEFNFSMLDGKDYIFIVEAEGYAPHQETLKADSANNGKIQRQVALKPTGVNQLIRLEKLIFALGKATITSESYQELDELVAMLQNNANMEIQLEGHTDARGNARLNMKLSEDRVDAVKDYLVGKGIDKRRIKTKAFGGTKPLSTGDDAESRRRNRRVEVRILSN
ncbi:MAG: OmpA family protein [Fulvivirga sp.]